MIKKNVCIKHKFIIRGFYFFEFVRQKNDVLKIYFFVVNFIIRNDTTSISMANLNERSVNIRKNQLLKRMKYIDNVKQNLLNIVNFNFENVFNEKYAEKNEFENVKNSFAIELDSIFESAVDPDINDHWKKEFKTKMNKILKKYSTFFKSNFEKFVNEIKMSIPFQNENDIKKLKQTPYTMSMKDRKAMNEILNSFEKDDRIQKMFLKTIFSTTSFVFVIWKGDKSKIVINLKKINIKLHSNVYSLSKQNIILSSFDDSEIFFFIDLTKGFFQQNTDLKNWWKTTFVTSHKSFEWLTISNMKLKNTSDFFQNRMKKIFEFYFWKFVFVYMNDIIVFFSRQSNIFIIWMKSWTC